MKAQSHRFAHEIRTFEHFRAAWVGGGKSGQWVAILGDRVLGPHPSLDDLWDEAVAVFQVGFMVKRVYETDRPIIVSNFEMTTEDDAT